MTATQKEVSLASGDTPAGFGRDWIPVAVSIIAFVIFLAVLFALLWLINGFPKNGTDIQTNAILISILPILIWLLVSGRITSFKAFGVELKSEIERLSNQSVKPDLRSIKYEQLSDQEKLTVDKIPQYIAQKTAALSSRLGLQGYYEPIVIKQYLDQMTAAPFFKWIVFHGENGKFAGLMPAQQLRAFAEMNGDHGYNQIKTKIEAGEIGDLPGCVPSELALDSGDTNKQAIEAFARSKFDDLPVINEQGKFVGVLNRGKINSELLASIVRAAET